MKYSSLKLWVVLVALSLFAFTSDEAMVEAEVANSNSRFAFEMLKDLPEKNAFVSPFSISTAMAMTYAGARGETAKEFEKALFFSNADGGFHKRYGTYQKQLNDNLSGVEWNLANKLWGQEGFGFEEDFLRVCKEDYRAPMELVQFSDAARGPINSWVEKQTNNRIKDLIPPGALTVDTRLVLTNAVFFKGDWEYQFKKSKTKEADFKLERGSKVNVDLMYLKGGFNYIEGLDYQAVQLPYKSKKQSMVIFLPKGETKLKDLQSKLSPADLQPFRRFYPNTQVEVYLPKFKMEYKIGLGPYFIEKGMQKSFGKGADFSGMTTEDKLWIDQVIHKAFVEVGEEGTEAAAATAVIMTTESTGPKPKPKPKIFKADHPFIFFIMDDQTGTVLFMGKLMAPKGK